MDFGEARFFVTHMLATKLLVVPSSKQPGHVYLFGHKLSKTNENTYECRVCRQHKKYRTITVLNGQIVCRKHPEDDHHPDRHSVAESVVEAQELDRQMRSSERESGKRPRDACTNEVTSLSERFKSSRVQADVIASFPSFGEVRRQLNRHRIARNIPVLTC